MNKQMKMKQSTRHQKHTNGTNSVTNAGLKSQIPTIVTGVPTADSSGRVPSSIWLTSDITEMWKRLKVFLKANNHERTDSEQTEPVKTVPHTYSLFGDE